jgi:diguanylate cyclase (GGDEF)-like protein
MLHKTWKNKEFAPLGKLRSFFPCEDALFHTNILIYKGKNTMDVQYDVKKNIPETIKAINNTYEVKQITYYENQLACMLSSPLMFLGALIRFLYILFNRIDSNTNPIINIIVFLCFGISFELLRKARLKVVVTSRILTGLFGSYFLFTYIRLYHVIGPAVWTIAVILIILSMSRLHNEMAVFITSIAITTCFYTLINLKSLEYQISLYYLIPQTFLLMLLFLILNILHKINTDRYQNLYKQYLLVNDQKSDITALYEELIASEDELRQQNNQLADYNKRFIAKEQKIHSLAYYDALTGLPNRTMFMEQLQQSIEICTRKSKPFYLVLFDVDYFKSFNKTSDYSAGDQYLLFVTDQMKKHCQDEDILSRINGDEFALLIRSDINDTSVLSEVEQMRSCFSQPFLYKGSEFSLSASYGISVFPRDGMSSSELLKSADMTLNEAKKSRNSDR